MHDQARKLTWVLVLCLRQIVFGAEEAQRFAAAVPQTLENAVFETGRLCGELQHLVHAYIPTCARELRCMTAC